jgi:predicted transcriptional regulator YdeE
MVDSYNRVLRKTDKAGSSGMGYSFHATDAWHAQCGRLADMEVKIENRPRFTVLGITGRGSNGPSFIPPLWELLNKKEIDIWHLFKSTTDGYGVMDNYDPETQELDYLAGHEAEPGTIAPEGLTTWDVPEETYAVIQCTIKTIMDAYRHFTEWCSDKGHLRKEGPEFEYYPEGWRETGLIYVYFPIEKT